MWTPRRILLLLTTLCVLVGVYVAYSRLQGGIDGLPELPQDYLIESNDLLPPQVSTAALPAHESLKRAFGATSPEVVDNGQAYKIKYFDRTSGQAIACGQPAFATTGEPSRFVTVSPFSVGYFGKPKAPGEPRLVGEDEEITTFHADKGILEFDRPVTSLQDMKEKCKIVGMELVSTPDVPNNDPRGGRIWVTNNQKSKDPGQFLVFVTTGPVYYRSPDETPSASPDAPQLWTNAAVSVIDKRNLPRPLRSTSTATALASGNDLRNRGAVSSILLGQTLPPPTITAEGMKIYLTRQDPKTAPKGDPKDGKRNATGYSGVRMVELSRKVQFNLWTDGSTGFPGTSQKEAPAEKEARPAVGDPTLPLAATVGGSFDGGAVARKLAERSLLIVETAGSFRFDFTTNLARFETDDTATPGGQNTVTVTRLSSADQLDNLFCKLLLVQFANTAPAPLAANAKAPQPQAPQPSQGAAGGLKIQSLTATGPHVYINVAAEGLLAQGTELKYAVDAASRMSTTTLRGTPVFAVREKNQLTGGDAKTPGEILISSVESAANSAEPKKTTLSVNGPGFIELFDSATGANTVKAVWGRSLTQEKVRVGKLDQDLLKFEGGAEFIDTKADMRLTASKIWLWLGAPEEAAAPGKKSTGGFAQSVPQRLDAVGTVKAKSAELVIQETDQLKLWFRDVAPPPVTKPPATVAAVAPPAAAPPAPGAPVPPPDVAKVTPEKPKPPIVLSARVIESWLARYPQALAVKTEVAAKAPPAMKYEMERAVCEERVVVHQDPTDPAKSPRGLDIAGGKLNLTATRVNGEVGQIMTVTAAPNQIAQVHFETLSLFGPTIKIDQVSNTVAIDGIGSMLMPSTSDFSGTPTDGVNELEIRWKRSMFFNGAKGSAEFLEQVNATQSPAREGLVPKPEKAPAPRTLPVSVKLDEKSGDGGSWGRTRVLCHRMDVTFDRPIYFNQFRRDASAGAAKDPQESPKLKTALCVPIPDDELTPQTNPLTRKVTFTEESYTRANRPLKFQRIECQQLEVRLREKSQEMFATGPGEVRILQPDSSEWGKPTPPPTPAVAKKSGEAAPFKLTLVKYTNRMVAVDKNKLFQSATFADGANAWQIPTNDINLKFLAHQAPEGTTTLSCSQSLEVSSSRPRPDAEPEQSMVALGNAEFGNDDYDGLATRITYDSKLVTLYGTSERLASIYRRKRSLNEPQALRARTIKYPKYGTISADEAGTGVFTP